ncbi:MAG: NAD-dependent epimerase/dehydratase family protein, partial [Chloroflexota bacterium]
MSLPGGADRIKKVLVTGASGQIGSELTPFLRQRYGPANVVAGVRRNAVPAVLDEGPREAIDVTRRDDLDAAIRRHGIDTIFHLAGVLSAAGEQDPERAWSVNVGGFINTLEAARAGGVARVFFPSSIAAFGTGCPRDQTPQDTVLQPATIYGVSKVTGELLGEYYVRRFGLDVRGLRLPGIISSVAPPGGGTTDYAVEIFYAAVKAGSYTCFLSPETMLPLMYMPDCLKAIVKLMEADRSRLTHHCGFNLTGFSATPALLAEEIRK